MRRGLRLALAADGGRIPLTLAQDESVRTSAFSVDAEARTIRNALIMRTGRIEPASGGEYTIDAATLAGLRDLVAGAANGVAVNSVHVNLLSGWLDDRQANVIGHLYLVGRIRQARLEGERLVGDIEVDAYADASPQGTGLGAYLLGVAERDPDKISLSANVVVMEAGDEEAPALRVVELRSIDFVRKGAATAGGLAAAQRTNAGGASPPEVEDDSMDRKQQLMALAAAHGLDSTWVEAQLAKKDQTPEQDEAAAKAASAGKATPPEPQAQALAERKRVKDLLTLGASARIDEQQVQAWIDEGTAAAEAKRIVELAQQTGRKLESVQAAEREAARRESERAVALLTLAEEHNIERAVALAWISEGRTIEQANADVLKRLREQNAGVALGAGRVVVGDDLRRRGIIGDAADAIVLGSGVTRLFEHDRRTGSVVMAYGEDGKAAPKPRKIEQRAQTWAGLSMVDIGKRVLAELGATDAWETNPQVIADLMVGRRRVRDVFPTVSMAGTDDLDYVLKDAINKIVVAMAVAMPSAYARIAQQRPARDFKYLETMRLSDAPAMERLYQGAEVQFVDMGDSGERYKAVRYAKGTKLTFEAIVNDDRGAFNQIPDLLLVQAYSNRDAVVFGILTANANMADANALFSEAHANIMSDSGEVGPPSVILLDAMSRMIQEQQGANGTYLALQLYGLIVPTSLEGTTVQLLGSPADPTSDNPNVFNRWADANRRPLVLVASPLLTANDAAIWYGFADPARNEGLQYATLQGAETPQVATETEFATGNVKIACVDVFGAKAVGWRGLVQNDGE